MAYNIYLITNIKNNKKYIGITKKDIMTRFDEHKKTALTKKRKFAIHHAIQKYGEENFFCILLENTEDKTRENFWIQKYNTRIDGYNLTDGGDGTIGHKFSLDQRKKISDNAKSLHKNKKIGMYNKSQSEKQKKIVGDLFRGKTKSSEQIEKQKKTYAQTISQKNYIHPNKGKKRTEEQKKKMSLSRADFTGENNPMYNKRHTKESRKLISEKAKKRERKNCDFCGKNLDVLNYNRWHGTKCKYA